MYSTSANDLERVVRDLNLIAQKYKTSAAELDQYAITLEGIVAHLVSGGVQEWKGISSDAFHGAWRERKARLQQASVLMNQSTGYLTQLARTIEDNLSTIRADQSVMSEAIFHTLGTDDQSSLMNEESQAQNAIFMAIAALNSQLEQLIGDVNDCPEADQDDLFPDYGNNVSRNDSNAGDGGGGKNDGEPNDPKGFEEPEPVGSLKRVDDKWLKRNGIDAHELKDALGGRGSEYDIYKDRDGNLFALRKNAPQSTAIWLGNLQDL